MQRLYEQFHPKHYIIHWDLTGAAKRTVSGAVHIAGEQLAERTITLHSKELAITSLTVNGTEASYTTGENDELIIEHAGTGKVEIHIDFTLALTDAMHGIYPCYYEVGGEKKELYASQFESHHAREAFPCVDEPEDKATFDVTLITDNEIVLSNMPESGKKGNQTTFATTPRMSPYLLAFTTGELHKKSAKTASGVEVNVWATPAQRPESLEFALDHAVKTIEFFDDYFGYPYPLPKSDHVALPDLSAGAMENWGLITYREMALLADPATTTIGSKQYIAEVVSHELSHQWFGNLVTMKWWNDLWLNESFATLMAYVAVDAIHPEWNTWLDFAGNESIMALSRDAIDGIQPVRVEVNHPDEIGTLFDGAIVYAKGARLMRMCQEFIGHDAFRKGLTSYFKAFAYQNTEANDLWAHLSTASKQDISHFMNTWIGQSGYPVLHVRPDGLAQEQFFVGPHEPSTKLWPIPLGAESTEDVPALLETRELALPIADDERFNVHNSGHFLTHYTPSHMGRILARLQSLDEMGRLQLVDEQTLLTRGGITPASETISLLQAYQSETSQHVWESVAGAFGSLKKFVEFDEAAEQKLRQFAKTLASPLFNSLGWVPQSDEPESSTKLRILIIGMMLYAEDTDVVAHANELYSGGIDTLDPEIRALIISTAVKTAPNTDIVEDLLALYTKSSSPDLKTDICAGISSIRQPEHAALVLKEFTNASTIRHQDIFRWFAYFMRNRYTRDATWQWMVTNWGWIEEHFASDKSYNDFPQYAAQGLTTREQLANYIEFFTPKRSVPALTRTIDLGIKEIEGRLELLERDGEAVRSALLSL